MYAASAMAERDFRPTEDHVVFLDGTWDDYERVLAMRGDRSAPRISYLHGVVEIMSPSRDHEAIKSLIGRLVDVYCLERGIRFEVLGSWTLKDKPKRVGAEPGECFLFGDPQPDATRPHLAIEVEWTSGRLDKLEVYRKLGVREVWYWQGGRLTAHVLRGDAYEAVPKSEALPGIDLEQLISFLDRPTTFDAVRDYRAALASS